MKSLSLRLLLATCVTALATGASGQDAATGSAVLRDIPRIYYPPIAASARISGKVDVRVLVRPDGTVAEVTFFPQPEARWKQLFYATVADAAARASFECRGCTQPGTPHTLTFVFSFDGFDSAGHLLPTAWKQTGDGTSEVMVFGEMPVCDHCPRGEPLRKRAAQCLWLWHCSE